MASCATITTDTAKGSSSSTNNTSQPPSDPNGHSHQTGGYDLNYGVEQNLTEIQPIDGRSIPIVRNLGLLATPTASVQMEILVVAATQDEVGLAAVEALLKQVGVPYNVLIASTENA